MRRTGDGLCVSILGESAEKKGWYLSCLALCGLGSLRTGFRQTNVHLFGPYFWDCDTVLGRHCSVSIQCFAEGQRRWGRERQVARVEREGQHWRTVWQLLLT